MHLTVGYINVIISSVHECLNVHECPQQMPNPAPICNERKRKRGGVQCKPRFEWQIQLKSLDFDNTHITADIPCGHFAIGNLSETCTKHIAFDVNARPKIDIDTI